MQDFLLGSQQRNQVVFLENIDSPEFGRSDLIFVSQQDDTLNIVRLNDEHQTERFVVTSLAYCLWIRHFTSVHGALLNTRGGLTLHLISCEFAPAVVSAAALLAGRVDLNLVRYQVLMIEGLNEPIVYFEQVAPPKPPQHVTGKLFESSWDLIPAQEGGHAAPSNVTAEEMGEFNRLLKQHFK